MKIYNLIINLLFLSYSLIEVICEEDKYIEKTIYIEDGYPFIKLNISGQGEKKFYLSLLFPTIVAYPNNGSQDYRFNSAINETFNDINISLSVKDSRSNFSYDLEVGEAPISLNNNDIVFNISVLKNHNLDGQFAGIFGLNRGVDGNKFDTLIEQLFNKKLISKKLFYIGPYYQEEELKKESKLVIGKIPDSIKKYFDSFSNCSLVSNSYKCNISEFSFGKPNKKPNSNKRPFSKDIYINFVEGKIDKTILPVSLIEYFLTNINRSKKKNNCNIDGNTINCPKNIENVSFLINKQEFKLSSIWENKTLYFNSNINNDTIIMGSELGNFHRIYDIGENRIYFLDKDSFDKAVSEEKENKIWVFIIIISTLLLLLCIIIIYRLMRKNKINKRNYSVSFQGDLYGDDEEDKEINLAN
mgnify:CR=1 FL=1